MAKHAVIQPEKQGYFKSTRKQLSHLNCLHLTHYPLQGRDSQDQDSAAELKCLMKIVKAAMDFERQNVSLSEYMLPDKIKK